VSVTRTDSMMLITNDEGGIVYAQGKLPDGTYGIIADQARPFTKEEMADPVKFATHRDDLANRVQAEMEAAKL
jgi:hypothetical protein